MADKAIILGDTHFPWHDQGLMPDVIRFIEHVKPTLVVQIGDLVDNFSFSRFEKNVDIITPKQELQDGRRFAAYLWSEVHRVSPRVERLQIRGNHEDRFLKRIQFLAPELRELVLHAADKLLSFDGVSRHSLQSRDDWFCHLEGMIFRLTHGSFSSTLEHVKHYLENIVIGHLHRGEVQTFGHGTETLWGLNVGYLGDPKAPVFDYTKTTLTGWTQGLGMIDGYGPRFIHAAQLKER